MCIEIMIAKWNVLQIYTLMKTIGEHLYLMVIYMEEKIIYHLDSFCNSANDVYRKNRMKSLVC